MTRVICVRPGLWQTCPKEHLGQPRGAGSAQPSDDPSKWGEAAGKPPLPWSSSANEGAFSGGGRLEEQCRGRAEGGEGAGIWPQFGDCELLGLAPAVLPVHIRAAPLACLGFTMG